MASDRMEAPATVSALSVAQASKVSAVPLAQANACATAATITGYYSFVNPGTSQTIYSPTRESRKCARAHVHVYV